MSIKSFFDGLVGREHTFINWAEGVLLKLEGAAPTFERLFDTELSYIGPALQQIVTLEGGAADGAAVGKVIKTIQSDLTAASGLLTDFGPSPSINSILTAVQTNLQTLLTDTGVKNPKSVAAVQKVITEVSLIIAAIQTAEVLATPATPPTA